MFVLKALLTLMKYSELHLSKVSSMVGNSSVCASRIIVRHELCADRECHHPVLLNMTEMHVPSSICIENKIRDPRLCSTKDCLYAAATVLTNMNTKIKPCDNFFQFACGNFVKKTRIQELGFVDADLKVNEAIRVRLWNEVETPNSSDEPHVNTLVKKIYKACLNTNNIVSKGASPLLNLLKRIGGWPILEGDAWNETNYSWQKTVYRCREEGCNTHYIIKFDSKYLETPKKGLYPYFTSAELELEQPLMSRGLNTPTGVALYDFMVRTAVLLGANHTTASNELKDVINFEQELSLKIPKHQGTPVQYIFSIAELSKRFPKMDWLTYINKLAEPLNVYDTHSVIAIEDIFYIQDLLALLERTSKRVLANYLGWRTVSEKLFYLTDDFQKQVPTNTRDIICKQYLIDNMPIALSSMYVRKYFNQPLKDLFIDIFREIISQFLSMLQRNTWINPQTKQSLLNRLNLMEMAVAFPFDLIHRGLLDQYYETLHFTSDNFFESAQNLTIFNHQYVYKRPWDKDNKTNCINHEHLPENKALFEVCSSDRTMLAISAGYLRGIFYSLDYPYYMLFGTVGTIIAREIARGFEIEDLMLNNEKKIFYDKKKCFISQYSKYKASGTTKTIPDITAPENIADTVGIKVAYMAMDNWISNHGKGKLLLGLEQYNAKQLFWLTSANMWCAKYNYNVTLFKLDTDTHAPNDLRVIGPFSNMKQFSTDFNCPAGSFMNPADKCEMWS